MLSWAASPDAVKYHVYRDGAKLAAEPTATTFTDADRPDGRYSYEVRAVNGFGDVSDASTAASVHVDKTRPTIGPSASPPANAAGWNNTPVTVGFACADEPGGSGVAGCTEPIRVDGDGAGQVVTGQAVDNAGNTASASQTVNLDRTAPVAGAPAWSTNPKPTGSSTTLTVPASDALSGVVAGEYYFDTDPGPGNGTPMTYGGGVLSTTIGTGLTVGVYQIGVRAKDAAGNWTAPPVVTILVVYDPSLPVGVTGKNKNDLVPSLANGDVLPGLTSAGQTDTADYGFTVDYTNGALDPRNDFMFRYNTGSQCNSPHDQNCHSFTLTATGFDWLIIDQANDSRGRFQGIATVTIDEVITINPFTVEGTDGDRLTPAGNDHFILKVYAPGADPTTASPVYQVSASFAKGNSVRVR